MTAIKLSAYHDPEMLGEAYSRVHTAERRYGAAGNAAPTIFSYSNWSFL